LVHINASQKNKRDREFKRIPQIQLNTKWMTRAKRAHTSLKDYKHRSTVFFLLKVRSYMEKLLIREMEPKNNFPDCDLYNSQIKGF
jgi:hypothetical protein